MEEIPPHSFQEQRASQNLHFDFSRTLSDYISVLINHSLSGHQLWWPRELSFITCQLALLHHAELKSGLPAVDSGNRFRACLPFCGAPANLLRLLPNTHTLFALPYRKKNALTSGPWIPDFLFPYWLLLRPTLLTVTLQLLQVRAAKGSSVSTLRAQTPTSSSVPSSVSSVSAFSGR